MLRNTSGLVRPILFGIALISLCLGACKQRAGAEKPAESADEFVARINKEMAELQKEKTAAEWVQANYINDDTEMLNAGRRFAEMLALGQSQPWQDTLEKLTGTREMDASAIIDYFAPLMGWLKEQNQGQQCGW